MATVTDPDIIEDVAAWMRVHHGWYAAPDVADGTGYNRVETARTLSELEAAGEVESKPGPRTHLSVYRDMAPHRLWRQRP